MASPEATAQRRRDYSITGWSGAPDSTAGSLFATAKKAGGELRGADRPLKWDSPCQT